MSTPVTPFGSVERALMSLLVRDYAPLTGLDTRVGGNFPSGLLGTDWYIRVEKIPGGRANSFQGDFVLDLEVFSQDYLLADRADAFKQLSWHAQLQGFLPVGIGDVTGLEPGRTAGNPGDGLGNTATGTGLGGARLRLLRKQVSPQPGSQFSKTIHRVPPDLIQTRWIPYTTRLCDCSRTRAR